MCCIFGISGFFATDLNLIAMLVIVFDVLHIWMFCSAFLDVFTIIDGRISRFACISGSVRNS